MLDLTAVFRVCVVFFSIQLTAMARNVNNGQSLAVFRAETETGRVLIDAELLSRRDGADK